MRAYYWRARSNWGDQLSPLLLEHFAGIKVEWSAPADAEIVSTGSVLDVLPADWSGIVLGSGFLHAGRPLPRAAQVLALRGRLSVQAARDGNSWRRCPASRCVLGRGDIALGDPGLLVSEMVPVVEKRYKLAVVPHWSDTALAKRFAHLEPHVIDPASDPLDVLADLAASERIVSSSLHGIIAADAFRIPRRAEQYTAMSHPYEGGTFKFDDYSSVLGEPMVWGRMHMPDQRGIERAQAELFDAFRAVRHV